MGRKEGLVYTRMVRLQSCEGMRVLWRPLRNIDEENHGEGKDKDTYYFHATIHTT